MSREIPPQIVDYVENLDYSPECELIFGLTYAAGTDCKPVQECIERTLQTYGYKARVVRVSDLISNLTDHLLRDGSEIDRISSRMDAGNEGCRDSKRCDLWALAAIGKINSLRGTENQTAQERVAHIILSLKRPEEVSTLRKVYGPGFFLIGVFATEKERLDHLIEKNAPKMDAINLIKRDEDELSDPFGQKTSKTFQLADVFVQLRSSAYDKELTRFLSLVFSNPYETPTQQENAMFLAYASSLRSGQLGRQVGAAITSKGGDVIAVGCNDVPRPGGGLYWPGTEDRRDHIRGSDSNNAQIDKIVDSLLVRLGDCVADEQIETLRKDFRGALDITEYGRAVHAEMDALITCARSGVSPAGGILYATTFPCHNCTRHIIAAGIQRVYYIEPYPKSKAEELHEDAIVVEEKSLRQHRGPRWKLPYTHFVGIGPRRYFDLFSLNLSSGFELQRKAGGRTLSLNQAKSWPRVPLSPLSYLQREREVIEELGKLFHKTSGR
ncbi:MAG: anti-phage dCTP deaminase [Terracidiphilus sp.]|jgi:deoxycytidylate deaminase